MDQVLSTFFDWHFILFCLGISAITFVIRKIVNFIILDNPKVPIYRSSKVWNELLLPIAPIVNGVLIAVFAKNLTTPAMLGDSTSNHVMYGLVGGLLSGLVYRVMVGMLKQKIQESTGSNVSINPDITGQQIPPQP